MFPRGGISIHSKAQELWKVTATNQSSELVGVCLGSWAQLTTEDKQATGMLLPISLSGGTMAPAVEKKGAALSQVCMRMLFLSSFGKVTVDFSKVHVVITCFYFLYPGKCVLYTYPGSILWLLTLTKAHVLECDSVKRDTFRYDVNKLFSITKGVDNLRGFVSLSWTPFLFLFCWVEKGHFQWWLAAFLISFYCCLPVPTKNANVPG